MTAVVEAASNRTEGSSKESAPASKSAAVNSNTTKSSANTSEAAAPKTAHVLQQKTKAKTTAVVSNRIQGN